MFGSAKDKRIRALEGMLRVATDENRRRAEKAEAQAAVIKELREEVGVLKFHVRSMEVN